jgi:hypothetical protein
VTAASNGVTLTDGTYSRDKTDLNPGANLHLGFTSASVDGTVNPDFSQVESDAGQVTLNQRFALFYAEKRPFFLEGIELFSTPNQLVYTRQIAEPIAGAKVTGKFGPLNVAYLSVKDKSDAGGAFFNIARVRRDIGRSSTVGVTVTDRSQDGGFNRVVAADSRIVFAKLYYVQGQIGGSWTGTSGETLSAPVWLAEFDRTGRAWGFNYKLTGVGTGFEAGSGYVPRNDIVEFHAANRFSWYGARGAFVEQFTTFFGPGIIWRYSDFPSTNAIEGSQDVNLMFSLRGGWNVRGEINRSFVDFDPRDYRGYEVQGPSGLAPFTVPEGLSGLFGTGVTVSTPTYKTFNASVQAQRQAVPIFPEASEGRETLVAGTLGARPTESIRIDGSLTYSRITRLQGGNEFAQTVLPRLKMEYQPTRALFFRVVGEYRSQRQAALVDPATGQPIYLAGAPIPPTSLNGLRVDFLLSYEPTPGTVVFIGYGSSLATTRMLSLADLHRQNDGFFVKLAYLFRR